MRRLILSCSASLLLYFAAFAFVLDRPLTLGALRARLDANLAYGRSIHVPKLVIFAGSNGPYSHRCATIAPIIGRPCVNAGVAVGVGLDYLFTRWKPWLHPGDVVYLPMEEVQYARPRATSDLGPDAAIMLRHDWSTLARLPLHRQIAALFAGDLRGAIMSVIETALVLSGFHDPRTQLEGGYDKEGDHIGHTAALGAVNQRALAVTTPFHPTAAEIRAGYGTVEIGHFLDWARANGIRAIGGLPTGFIDSPMLPGARSAIRAIYQRHHAAFLQLPNLSRYPRKDFFDTPDHLNQETQIRHSIAIARALQRLGVHPLSHPPDTPAIPPLTWLASGDISVASPPPARRAVTHYQASSPAHPDPENDAADHDRRHPCNTRTPDRFSRFWPTARHSPALNTPSQLACSPS